MEMSKLIVGVILLTWVCNVIFANIIYSLKGTDVSFLLNYVNPILLTTLGLYMGKSGFENVNKIIQSDKFGNPKNK